MKSIAIVDDEEDIATLIEHHLDKAGYRVKHFHDGKSFLTFIENQEVDLIVLDLMLPDFDGLEICKELRQNSQTKYIPIIMLTAKTQEFDKVLGLELGADDYMTKPFSPRELVARVKSVLRRTNRNQTEEDSQIIIDDLIKIDLDKYTVLVDNEAIKLTKTEFKILHVLAEKRGRVYSRDHLLNYLWGNDKIVTDRTIDVHIKNLRDKLGKAGSYIKNLQGVGYKLDL